MIVTGGASVGEKDYAKAMFEPMGLHLIFSKVSIKPGKPVWLGRAGKGSLLAARYMMELVPLLRPEGREALIIGLGGGLLSSFFTVYDWNIETVEIDPGMLTGTFAILAGGMLILAGKRRRC